MCLEVDVWGSRDGARGGFDPSGVSCPRPYGVAPMDESQPLSPGFLRIGVKLPRGESYTPGEIARVAGVPLDQLGPIGGALSGTLTSVNADGGKIYRSCWTG